MLDSIGSRPVPKAGPPKMTLHCHGAQVMYMSAVGALGCLPTETCKLSICLLAGGRPGCR